MTDPTKAADVADWWARLKAAPAAAVQATKEFYTSGYFKKLAHESLDAAITLLETVGPFLPPPMSVTASLLIRLCKCVHGAVVDVTNLEELRDRCFSLLDEVLVMSRIESHISTRRSSSELPKLPRAFTKIMNRFNAFVEKAIAHCSSMHYTSREEIIAGSSKSLLRARHKQEYDQLDHKLRDLGFIATVKLTQDIFGMPKVAKFDSLEHLYKDGFGTGWPKGMPSCFYDSWGYGEPPMDSGELDCGELTPVKKERALKAPEPQPEPSKPQDPRQKGNPAQGGAQLFLSYRVPETGRKRHGGDRTVPLLKSALESHGYSVFVGESDIEGGASWAQTIQVAITDCQVFIPVCSKTYGDTKWTRRELHAADEADKEIMPLWHSGDYPPKEVSIYLGNLQRLPRGNQPLVQADFQSLVSDLVATVKKAGCLPCNPPGPSNQGLALDQGRKRI